MATISDALAIAIHHHQTGRLQAAEQIYRQILALDPNYADAWNLLGIINSQRGNHQSAMEYIGRAIGLAGNAAAFHSSLGNVYQAVNKRAEAAACYRRALELNPEFVEAHNNLGNLLQDQGKLDEAVACYRRALELKPDFAEAHNNLGNALRHQGKLDEAVSCYRRALELTPDYFVARNNLGTVLQKQGKPEEAVVCYCRALELNPEYAEAHNNLGTVLRDQGKRDEAVASHRRALELKPDYAEAHYNLGNVLKDQEKQDEAVACYRRALDVKPDYADAHSNLGFALREQGKLEEAVACYRRALEAEPDYADVHFNYASALLLMGQFDEGWPEYEWRFRCNGSVDPVPEQPRWAGDELAGRTILLRSEQGLGDTLQFIRYAELVKQRRGTVIAEVYPALARLVASCPGVDSVIVTGEPLPKFDFHVSVLSLPGIFRTSLSTIPAKIPYLSPDAAVIKQWKAEFGSERSLKIGIAWQGNPAFPGDRSRSIPLARFSTLACMRGVRLYSLQCGTGREQLSELAGQMPITDLGDRLGDFHNTAAIMRNLDLVITSDSAPAHLAGALGVPVWVALRFAPDWRWMLDGTDSPWYPTMRLYRQSRPADWQGVFERIEKDLAAIVAKH